LTACQGNSSLDHATSFVRRRVCFSSTKDVFELVYRKLVSETQLLRIQR